MENAFEVLLQSFTTILITEMGDKTQLLAFILATRFRKPWPVMSGVLVATVLNHLLAASIGVWLSTQISPQVLSYLLAAAFIGFAVWVLIPDQKDDGELPNKYGAFLTTLVVFFFAEMGDKTQLSTVALAAQTGSLALVTIGTTAGMMVADGLAVVFGERVTRVIPMIWIHRFAAFMFLAYAGWILYGAGTIT